MPFSYAQAAKGSQGTRAPSKTTPTEQEKSDSKPEELSNHATTEPVTAASEAETPRETEKVTQSTDQDAEFTTVTSKHTARTKAAHSRTSSPNVRSTTQPKETDSTNTPNGTAEASSEKQDKSDAKAEKSENGTEGSKEKSDKSEKGEKGDKGDKSEKSAPPKELKAAPLPSVNIWQQRKEAQEAKTKTVPASTSGKSASAKADDGQQESTKAASKKKGPDGVQDGTKDRKKTEGGKARDEALPPVADASLWPTPQVALGEEKKKAQEKTDKPQATDKSPVNRSHGKEKWMPVNYVPSAVFNTPLPSAGGRGGRRATRGGRDGGRGGAHGAGEKPASGQPAQGATAKQNAGERGRNEPGTGRATSLPAQSRRSTSSDVSNPDGRKAHAGERGRGPRGAEEAVVPNGKQTNDENFARPQRDGKQFARNHEPRGGNSKATNLAVDPQAATRAHDRRTESGSKSADPTGFQDFNRERGGRPNRRGPYAGFNGQNGQFGNMANNNFVPKQFGGFNDRQRSQHGMPNGSQLNNRMPVRSPSLPASGNMYGVYGFPADINTMYGYHAMPPAPMSAVPYTQFVEPLSLMGMLATQLDYYFSVDNMCKDMFLRKKMDSQGFVPLSVVANFKRVKSLTEDLELLRHVSRQLEVAEYVVGEDGVDRLRPRVKWEQWVLPADMRDPPSQNDGPAHAKQPGKTDENVPLTNGAIHGGSREFIPNGTAHHGTRTPLSAPLGFLFPAKAGDTSAGFSLPPMAPLDDSLVDGYDSARGLDSTLHDPLAVDWGRADDDQGSSDAGRMKRQQDTRSRASTKPANKQNRPPPERKKKKKGLNKEKSANAYNSPDKSLGFASRDQSPRLPSPPGLVTRHPYRYWSESLLGNFDLQLYNDFRRLALDELFTRHIQDGFDTPLPEEVITDIVHLSRNLPFQFNAAVLDLLQSAMSSGLMEQRNRIKAGNAFNREYRRPVHVTRTNPPN
ncbi:hypothetical protein N7492_010232 [Penicillium capsulatum]|uniref:HTH La-type RNA-binding domain-containing protein n=1 Tax=Penicillium capsulatum TaxID=69766 RepID=A0A9W9HM15_9EURO|nr:hypothetical protein N7492_010232 [Penicillium capsulatum]